MSLILIVVQYVDELLDKGAAYKCFCSDRRLELLRKESARSRTANIYDRKCLGLSRGEVEEKLRSGARFTVRFKLSPIPEPFQDLVYGPVVHDVYQHEGDPIILKSDGFPTYHLANVVDDHLMDIRNKQKTIFKHLIIIILKNQSSIFYHYYE